MSTETTLTERVQQARWEQGVAAGLSSSDAALYAEGKIDLPGEPLAIIREPLDYDKGLDVVDSRTGETLAWRASANPDGTTRMEDTWRYVQEIADKLNETYPNRDSAPAHDTLVHEIVGWRITGVAG